MILACEDHAVSPCLTLQHLAKPNQLLRIEAKVWSRLDFAQVHSQDSRRFSGREFLLIISWGGRLFCMLLPCSCYVVAMMLLCLQNQTKPNYNTLPESYRKY